MAKVRLSIKSPAQGPQQTDPPPKKVLVRVKSKEPANKFNEYEKDIDTNLASYDKSAKDFFNTYLSSPLYKQRLISQGYGKPEDAINLRKANLSVTSAEKKLSETSEYDPKTQKINISPYDYLVNQTSNPKSIVAHEYSHVAGSMHPLTPKMPFPLTLSNKEMDEIYKRNKLNRIPGIVLNDQQRLHDVNPQENKADMDTLRYLLYTDGIYDAGKQQFSKEILQKAKQKYGSDGNVKRLLSYFSDDDIIWMMNNIAKNDTSNKPSSIT